MRLFKPLLLAMMATASVVATGAAYTLPIPAGTAISVHVTDSISSSSASEGQAFSVVVADPLVMQGWVVVQKGANGQGHVVAVNPAGKGGHEASVSVQLDWVVAVSGQHLELTAIKGKTVPVVFGVNGSYASNFQKGKEVTIGPELVFPGYTSADRVVTISAGS